jgi:hypothetical protein
MPSVTVYDEAQREEAVNKTYQLRAAPHISTKALPGDHARSSSLRVALSAPFPLSSFRDSPTF